MKRKKILIFGAKGMAGHIVYHYLNNTNKYDIVNAVHNSQLNQESVVLDITNQQTVIDFVKETAPDYIINCIGVLVNASTNNPGNAIYINAYFPHLLKDLANQTNSKLIHISTDCVFSGKKGNYSESDSSDAKDVYGKTKSLGEIISNPPHLTIRTSIIGPELKQNGTGLFHWFMNQKGEILGFKTAIWSGVTTLELAKAIDYAIDNNSEGLVHLSNGLGISKYDLLTLIKTIWKKDDISILPNEGNNINKSLKSSDIFNFKVLTYNAMLDELYLWMLNNSTIYNKIYK